MDGGRKGGSEGRKKGWRNERKERKITTPVRYKENLSPDFHFIVLRK